MTDRRYMRTEKVLIEAMLTLIREKPFHLVTVEEVVKQADVAKKTFYNHYENKEQLLWHALEARFHAIAEETAELDPHSLLMDGKPLSYPVFKHVYDYAIFYQGILAEKGEISFILQLWDYLSQQSMMKHEPLRAVARHVTVPPALTAQMLTGALLGAVRWWLRTGLVDTPEQMAYRFSQLMAPGVLQSLGIDEGE